jgi:hypothetical protein
MNTRTTTLLAALALLVAAPPATASDPIGIYALVEGVTLEPSGEAPERIRIDGAFALAYGPYGINYTGPRWGFLYLEVVPGKEAECLKEWRDLTTLKGEVVGLGSRHEMKKLTIRPAGATAKDPDLYPLGWGGVARVRNAAYSPVAQLRSLPRCVSPVEPIVAATSPLGQQVTLTAKNAADNPEGTKYIFELETPSGGLISSGLIAPGEGGKTSWSVSVFLTPGERLTWRVRAVREGLARAGVATMTVEVKAPEKDD